MAIIFHNESMTFHLYNDDISYIFRVMENRQLEQIHFGNKVADRASFTHLNTTSPRNFAPETPCDREYLSLTHTKQEYPSYGSGDYRDGAVTISQKNGSSISDFKYKSHEIYCGKRDILPLPATYVETEDEADSLEITLYDDVSETELLLKYTIYNQLNAITRSAKFTQEGDCEVVLDRALSACIDFSDMDYEMLHLTGGWSRERYVKTRRLEHGIQSIQSLRGSSSAEHNPFIALKRPHTTEFTGNVYGFSLIYSCNFLAQVEVCTHNTTRVVMGIHPETFEWPLNKGESFQTPEVVMVFSNEGLNGMSQTFHKLYNSRLVRGIYRQKERPILLNNWEATYFDFNEQAIVDIAKKATEVGIELFVLDDGWFGKRDDDTSGLGDWYVNTKKLENGITGLADKINKLGLDFGLWIEPEMVNEDSDLYKKHPEWVISTPNRARSLIRNQMVLDFSNPDVVEYIYDMLYKVISTANISYIKWDMNRYLSECYSSALPANKQKQISHRYILGVYSLYDKLIKAFPKILFESCSGGGARFDAGMLFYAPQAWCSDCTDAMDRLNIQYGTSMVYPISSIGAHVSAVPNHQLYRTIPIDMRATVAFFGDFGYELDLNKLTDEEIELVKKQILYYKQNRKLIHSGDFYRILSPFDDMLRTSWAVVSNDKTEAILAYYQTINQVNAAILFIKFVGLDADKVYDLSYFGNHGELLCKETTFSGSELMEIGIPISKVMFAKELGDYTSILIKAVAR